MLVLTLRVLFMKAILSALLRLLLVSLFWLSASVLFWIYSFRREATDDDSDRIEFSRWG